MLEAKASCAPASAKACGLQQPCGSSSTADLSLEIVSFLEINKGDSVLVIEVLCGSVGWVSFDLIVSNLYVDLHLSYTSYIM